MAKRSRKGSSITILCEKIPEPFVWLDKKPTGYRGYNCYVKTVGRLKACEHPVTGKKEKCVDVAQLAEAPYGIAKVWR